MQRTICLVWPFLYIVRYTCSLNKRTFMQYFKYFLFEALCVTRSRHPYLIMEGYTLCSCTQMLASSSFDQNALGCGSSRPIQHMLHFTFKHAPHFIRKYRSFCFLNVSLVMVVKKVVWLFIRSSYTLQDVSPNFWSNECKYFHNCSAKYCLAQ